MRLIRNIHMSITSTPIQQASHREPLASKANVECALRRMRLTGFTN
ncbi:hypothetical protein OESDEN_15756 [Oesophagostomum dentatum]|uniref:Uncharacterized protein n=1 Tax=Oesophagostomum dentatum TaxID=61180 RepID=A0A0B1SGR9_OESDE|nr:hypothetical protein OESDEN_15756 [Oesophagostomum dentatum]